MYERFTDNRTPHQIDDNKIKEINYPKVKGEKISKLVISKIPENWNNFPYAMHHKGNNRRFITNYDKLKRGDTHKINIKTRSIW